VDLATEHALRLIDEIARTPRDRSAVQPTS
jgi:hypothetical protein